MAGLFDSSATVSYHNLTPAQFADGMRQPQAVLLDVRRPDEFVLGHLPGARNLDVIKADFAQRVASLDTTRPIYVYCRSGVRSAAAAKHLCANGFDHVFNLAGGILEWPHPLVR